ncbi:MAG: Holliday junction branch migration protein RuvA [Pseudomonadales bacterium]|jgi:Holliday junction DNA helicase RuvA|nr:Holliday junction branch migration protein RuvA [Pseudomonadales bacterium]MDP6470988.1 Holliday junction branch migration protein RuvA [Pseudomonadales bacterium]MDP6825827.1 Holliday junction branch migration protein RuvA [Pseudomonadales bacterium]MDP6970180.1 Holliday junction branch migration protein RuvA [Pseudomonadales bacterium]
MIARLQGKLVELSENVALLDVAGVGYEVELSGAALDALPPVGGEVTTYTHFVVREDVQSLFGFASRAERDLFRTFIRINGVGPKLGLALISSVAISDLSRAVEANDVSMLTRVPGVGKKTAERLLVELRDKLPMVPGTERAVLERLDRGMTTEAESALVALGYKPAEAARVISGVAAELEDIGSTDDILRAAFRRLARQTEMSS